MKNLIFFNNFHNGDIHYSRSFILDIMKKTNFNCFYNHLNSNLLLKDIPTLNYLPNKRYDNNIQIITNDNEIIINTWVGQNNAKYIKMSGKSCSIYTNYELYKNVFDNLSIKMENLEYYIPKINWDLINKNNIDIFIKQITGKKIIISNGSTFSGQAPPFLFDDIIKSLANEFKEISFILTKKINLRSNNIYYTDDIINQNNSDLNEISYLSLFCDIIIGRASGPFAFCHTQENLTDENKVFISFSNNDYDSNWYVSEKCKQVWSNNFSHNNIYNKIRNEIKNKIKI